MPTVTVDDCDPLMIKANAAQVTTVLGSKGLAKEVQTGLGTRLELEPYWFRIQTGPRTRTRLPLTGLALLHCAYVYRPKTEKRKRKVLENRCGRLGLQQKTENLSLGHAI